MRLARLVAAGLVLGVVAGFVVALLRPRPQTRFAGGSSGGAGPALDRAVPRFAPEESGGPTPVIDVRVRRPVTG